MIKSGFRESAKSGYLAGIDGLRAIAVLSVITFHFDETLLRGGFIGVDIFFVISGYVISKSLFATSDLTFPQYVLSFYKRRVLRIGPALILCLSVTAVASSLFVVPSWLSETNSGTGLAAFVGLSNLYLVWRSDGYFGERIVYNPYAHTWSLAVEEQFYVIFPFLFFFWLRALDARKTTGRRLVFKKSLIPILAILSLGFAAYQSTSDPQWAFYLLPSRFWELAAGAILFQAHARGRLLAKRQTAPLLSATGILLIGVGFVFMDVAGFPFPWALAPVVGTACLITSIVSPAASIDPVRSFLAAAPVRYVGLLSYSLYLWHWPVFTLVRWTLGLESATSICVALIGTAVLSVVSFHFVERPVRSSRFLRRQTSWLVVSGGIACMALGIAFTYQLSYGSWIVAQSVVEQDNGWRSDQIPRNVQLPTSAEKPLSGRTLFVIGDSHAGAYRAMLEMASRDLGLQYEIVAAPGCSIANLRNPHWEKAPRWETVSDWGPGHCRRRLDKTIANVENAAKIGDGVFLASFRTYRLSRQSGMLEPEAVREAVHGERAQLSRQRALADAEKVINRLQALGLHVLLDAPKPTFLAPPFRCMDWFNRNNPVCAPRFEMPRDTLLEINRPILDSLAQLQSANSQVMVWDPFPPLCPTDVCSAFNDDIPLFFDGDHLTGYGNAQLYPSFRRIVLKLFQDPSRDDPIDVPGVWTTNGTDD